MGGKHRQEARCLPRLLQGIDRFTQHCSALSDIRLFLWLDARQIATLQSHTRVFAERLFMAHEEIPVQNRERTGIVTGALVRFVTTLVTVIAHALYVLPEAI